MYLLLTNLPNILKNYKIKLQNIHLKLDFKLNLIIQLIYKFY